MRLPIALQEILEARKRIRPFLERTPFRSYATLDAELGQGTRVWIKHENHHPTNAFKARNALAALTLLSDEEKRAGVIAASRGNHGQALAWAGGLLGIGVTICVPFENNRDKNAAIRGFGAELVEAGSTYDETLETAAELQARRGLRMVHSSNDRQVVAGAGTAILEMLEEQPRLDAMILPVGGGSLAAGAVLLARWLKPDLRVYAVQAENASAVHDSFHAGRALTKRPGVTYADGLATGRPYETTFETMCWGLSGFVTVSEQALAEAIAMLLDTTHNLAEGAGAAGLAALRSTPLAQTLAGKRVGLVISGSNIEREKLQEVLGRVRSQPIVPSVQR